MPRVRHITSKCPNKKVISLAEYEALKNEFVEKEKGEYMKKVESLDHMKESAWW